METQHWKIDLELIGQVGNSTFQLNSLLFDSIILFRLHGKVLEHGGYRWVFNEKLAGASPMFN